jgi:hypothetical protein
VNVPPQTTPAPARDAGLLHTLGWAAFLGVSWTWCIGMFLPVLLVRDYGWLGWVVFAIPNVAGAAAMGRVLAGPTAAERVAWAHRGAGVFFSVVTIAFHAYWVCWVVQALIGPAAPVAFVVLAAGFFVAGRATRRADLLLAAAVWGVSMVLFAAYLALHAPRGFDAGQLPRGELLPLGLVCVLGFALCPYLDLTFLRVRQATAPRAGVAAFALDFGVLFLVMIGFTLCYAPALAPRVEQWHLRLSASAAWALGVHMTVQAALTCACHARELARRWAVPEAHVRAGGLGAVVASLFPLAAGSLGSGSITAGEQSYRLFLAFYALIFPAYVWMLMIPRRGATTAEPTRAGLAAFAAVVAVAAPMYWIAFVNGRMTWLFPGVAVVLLGRFVVPRGSARAAMPKP